MYVCNQTDPVIPLLWPESNSIIIHYVAIHTLSTNICQVY